MKKTKEKPSLDDLMNEELEKIGVARLIEDTAIKIFMIPIFASAEFTRLEKSKKKEDIQELQVSLQRFFDGVETAIKLKDALSKKTK